MLYTFAPLGPIIRFMRENQIPKITQNDASAKIGIPYASIAMMELQPYNFSQTYVTKFSDLFGIPERYLTILNNVEHFSAEEEATALYEIFVFVRGQQDVKNDINKVLSLMRLVAGYTDCRRMSIDLTEIDEQIYGIQEIRKKSILPWQQVTIKRLEKPQYKPTKMQLLSYSVLFDIPIESLTFWLDKQNVFSVSDEKKKEILYSLFSAARDIYNYKFEKTRWELL